MAAGPSPAVRPRGAAFGKAPGSGNARSCSEGHDRRPPASASAISNRHQKDWWHLSGRLLLNSTAAVIREGAPPPHGGGIDPEEVGDLLGRVPLGDALDGEAPSVLQLVRWASGSHAEKSTTPEARSALLF
jgi:hypothetical protein